MLASGVVFGWAHLVFVTAEPVTGLPVALTVTGGVLFAWTCHRSGSLVAAWIEHALYGCCVFTIGLGWLFYGGRCSKAHLKWPGTGRLVVRLTAGCGRARGGAFDAVA